MCRLAGCTAKSSDFFSLSHLLDCRKKFPLVFYFLLLFPRDPNVVLLWMPLKSFPIWTMGLFVCFGGDQLDVIRTSNVVSGKRLFFPKLFSKTPQISGSAEAATEAEDLPGPKCWKELCVQLLLLQVQLLLWRKLEAVKTFPKFVQRGDAGKRSESKFIHFPQDCLGHPRDPQGPHDGNPTNPARRL